MHHYGIEVPDRGKGVRDMDASQFALVQGRRHNETRFAYFDTTGDDRRIDRDRLSAARGESLHAQPQAQEIARCCAPCTVTALRQRAAAVVHLKTFEDRIEKTRDRRNLALAEIAGEARVQARKSRPRRRGLG